eukprot:scaffold246_cov414-Prasinococcus_capsulatus_cf.AAC.27
MTPLVARRRRLRRLAIVVVVAVVDTAQAYYSCPLPAAPSRRRARVAAATPWRRGRSARDRTRVPRAARQQRTSSGVVARRENGCPAAARRGLPVGPRQCEGWLQDVQEPPKRASERLS